MKISTLLPIIITATLAAAITTTATTGANPPATTTAAAAAAAVAQTLADCTDIYLTRYSELHARCPSNSSPNSSPDSDFISSTLDLDTCFGAPGGALTYAAHGRFSEGCHSIWLEAGGVWLGGNATHNATGASGPLSLEALCLTGIIVRLPQDNNAIDADRAIRRTGFGLGPETIQVREGRLACHS
ncbi:hypothetical protein F4779DRAFT_622158 [Xylariaceae sp. FL0662B]|nr:hypothetical protein F4779DRAFT_622158 [Xylariaceae sp. FL0662B]